MNLSIDVAIRGNLVSKKVDDVVKKAIVEETLQKINERLGRKGAEGSGGKGLGVKRNIVSRQLTGTVLTADTTKVWPRTRGTSWQRKNIAIIKAMAPRVLRKTADRIVSEL